MYSAVVLVQELVQQLCSKLYQETNLVQNWFSMYTALLVAVLEYISKCLTYPNNSLFAATEMFLLAHWKNAWSLYVTKEESYWEEEEV